MTPVAHTPRGLTAQEVSEITGVTPKAVRKRKDSEKFIIGHDVGGVGRSAILYDARVVSLWGKTAPEPTKEAARRATRADLGVPRSCSIEQWEAIVSRTKALFLTNAQSNLKQACEMAAAQLVAEGTDVPLNVYRRLMRKATDATGEYISEYRRENWEILHQAKWRKKDHAIAQTNLRYDYLRIFEAAGWAGPGYGALRAWAIDVRKNDVWVKADGGFSGDKEYVMPAAVYIRDALTGYPLWMEPIATSTETMQDILRSYISCGMCWGTFPDILVAMDNGRSMVAHRTMGVIHASLPESAWELAAEYPQLFGQKNPSPVLFNLPNIPQSPFKAALERSFGRMKAEFDATRSPHTYQGGSRLEATQQDLNAGAPMSHAMMMTAGEYYRSLASWLWSDYVTKRRDDPKGPYSLAIERGIEPTIEQVHRYYGGMKKRTDGQMPSGERLARMLYFATEKPHIVKAFTGYADTTIDGVYSRWMSDGLSYRHAGRRVAVIPIPGTDNQQAVVLLAEDVREPVFLCYADRSVIGSLEQLAEAKIAQRKIHAKTKSEIRKNSEIEDAEWSTLDPADEIHLPQTDDQIVGRLHEPHEDSTETGPVRPVDDADDDLDDLLAAADDLLD